MMMVPKKHAFASLAASLQFARPFRRLIPGIRERNLPRALVRRYSRSDTGKPYLRHPFKTHLAPFQSARPEPLFPLSFVSPPNFFVDPPESGKCRQGVLIKGLGRRELITPPSASSSFRFLHPSRSCPSPEALPLVHARESR